jgi:hypothetical protein
MKDGQYPVGQITAMDIATGNTVWQYQERASNYSAVLATAGGLVFDGDGARYFFALDADTGKRSGRCGWLPFAVAIRSALPKRPAIYRRGGRLWPEQLGCGDRQRHGRQYDLRICASGNPPLAGGRQSRKSKVAAATQF